ncbi:MAG: hypothetical protein M3P37_13200 [Actinomycetota bacterium]|nr:hypothetical protein [Actinomycetota bacterium]
MLAVLVLTISMEAQEHARAREAGADEVVSKAASLSEIFARIRRLANG